MPVRIGCAERGLCAHQQCGAWFHGKAVGEANCSLTASICFGFCQIWKAAQVRAFSPIPCSISFLCDQRSHIYVGFAIAKHMSISLGFTKPSSLMACSIRQASCSACSGSTPAQRSNCVKKQCRS